MGLGRGPDCSLAAARPGVGGRQGVETPAALDRDPGWDHGSHSLPHVPLCRGQARASTSEPTPGERQVARAVVQVSGASRTDGGGRQAADLPKWEP